MNKRIKLIPLGLVSALMLAIAAPTTAQAGLLTVYNKNCTKTANFMNKKRVVVYVYSKKRPEGCTDMFFSVHKGHSVTVRVVKKSSDGRSCGKYFHEAEGTAFGKADVDPKEDSKVICKKDWLGVCQCTKD